MPVYEYECQTCGHTLKKLQKRTDPAPEQCPECGATQTLERIISRASFHLKGGGWYDSGYASTAERKANASSTSASTESSTEKSSPSESSTSSSASTESTTSSTATTSAASTTSTTKSDAS